MLIYNDISRGLTLDTRRKTSPFFTKVNQLLQLGSIKEIIDQIYLWLVLLCQSSSSFD